MSDSRKLAELPKDRPAHEVAAVINTYVELYPNHITVRGLADGKVGVYKSYWSVT